MTDPLSAGGALARLDAFDRSLSARLLATPHGSRGRAGLVALRRISQTGSYGAGWIVLFALVATSLEGWLPALTAAGTVVGMLLTNSAVKLLVRRARPADRAISHQPTTYSMPSAHTSMAVVGATAMTAIAPGTWWLWFGWAAVLGVSRIMLGMHFAGDVMLGAALGAWISWLVVWPLVTSAL